ncbi:probable 2-ketogluconate reductase [Diadema setosum]|uniref:probable 2-ketogluconate reductase n=1 Tax=Diadema setosum TaxID=31175 RepID=UPI003B3AFD5E
MPTPVQDIIREKFHVVMTPEFEREPDRFRTKIQGILTMGRQDFEITETSLASWPNVKVVATNSVGTDHLNVQMLRSLGIQVGHTPDILSDATADLTFGLLIATARRFQECAMAMHQWGNYDPSHVINCRVAGTEVTRATLGIVGMGRIGMEVARRARGFKMRVLYYNRTRRSEEVEREVGGATYCSSLRELLPQVDFLVVMVPFNRDTEHLIGREELRSMKPSAIIINTSRGKVIDHAALIEALESKIIAGAGLDVTDPEPLPADSPLLAMPNVLLTPHVGSSTVQTLCAMARLTTENLAAGIEGRELPAEVPL